MKEHGGFREGSGRKAAPQKTKVRVFKAYDWEWELIKRHAEQAGMSAATWIKYKTLDKKDISETHSFFIQAYEPVENIPMKARSIKAFDKEWEEIKNNAQQAGMSLNAYIRSRATEPIREKETIELLKTAYEKGEIKENLALAAKLILDKHNSIM